MYMVMQSIYGIAGRFGTTNTITDTDVLNSLHKTVRLLPTKTEYYDSKMYYVWRKEHKTN